MADGYYDDDIIAVSLGAIRAAVLGEIVAHCDAIRGPYATLSEFEARLIAGSVVERLAIEKPPRGSMVETLERMKADIFSGKYDG